MNKQSIASKLERSILNRVRPMFGLLPTHITTENKWLFANVCEKVENITTEAFTEAESLGCRDYFGGWRRIINPFWRNGYGTWEYAYGDGFTWGQFVDYIVESGCTNVKAYTEVDIPSLTFSDDDGLPQFHIMLSVED